MFELHNLSILFAIKPDYKAITLRAKSFESPGLFWVWRFLSDLANCTMIYFCPIASLSKNTQPHVLCPLCSSAKSTLHSLLWSVQNQRPKWSLKSPVRDKYPALFWITSLPFSKYNSNRIVRSFYGSQKCSTWNFCKTRFSVKYAGLSSCINSTCFLKLLFVCLVWCFGSKNAKFPVSVHL